MITQPPIFRVNIIWHANVEPQPAGGLSLILTIWIRPGKKTMGEIYLRSFFKRLNGSKVEESIILQRSPSF